MDPDENFKINSSNQAFTERQKNVFDQLKVLEKEANIPKAPPVDLRSKINRVTDLESSISPQGKALKKYKRKESIFKKPDAPSAERLRSRSTFERRLDRDDRKWIKYNLDGVDVSDRSNLLAYNAFFCDLKARKQMAMDEAKDKELPTKIQFNRIAKKPKETEAQSKIVEVTNTDEVTFNRSKVVMPEYVVGQFKPKEKKQKSLVKDVETNKELKLDHLQVYDDGE